MFNSGLLSVCIISYNQAAFIGQAIESILFQEVDCQIELIISDDYSTDNTNKIIELLIKNHPKGYSIKYFRHEKNMGMMFNFNFALNHCAGKYIAICEGDDYWTDPLKLQKQIDFLESNSDFVICYHPVDVLFPDGQIEEDYQVKGILDKSESNIYDLAVLGNYIHTPSVVFRNILNSYPETFEKTPIGDYFLWMLLAQKGKIKKLHEVMAVYRHGVGIHSSKNDIIRSQSFTQTLKILAETITDKTIVEILRNRICVIKSASLPYPIRALEDYKDSSKAEVVNDYVGFIELVKAIWLKIKRKF